jgi:YVTN family beta-propeller protein
MFAKRSFVRWSDTETLTSIVEGTTMTLNAIAHASRNAQHLLCLGALLLVSGAIASAQPFVYVSNANDSLVSVINTRSNKVVAQIPVGTLPYWMAASPDGSQVWVSNNSSGTVSRIDTKTRQVTQTLTGFTNPNGLVFSPDGASVWIADGDYTGVVWQYDSAGSLLQSVSPVCPKWCMFQGAATSADGSRLYLVSPGNCPTGVCPDLWEVDTTQTPPAVVSTAALGNGPVGVAVNAKDTRLYVANSGSNNVFVLDPANIPITGVKVVDVGMSPESIAIDGEQAFVTNYASDNVTVFSLKTNKVTHTIPVGNGPQGICVDPKSKTAYVANSSSNSVSVIDLATYTVTATITAGIGAGPYAVVYLK